MKNMTMEQIEKELNSLALESAARRERLIEAALSILTDKLKDSEKLEELLSSVENSKDLGHIEGHEFYSQWVRFEPRLFIDTDSDLEKEVFQKYMEENHFMRIDFLNDILMMEVGPCIVINDDGDVLDQDSGKWIIDAKSYDDENERNALIESWMEKSGYFPSVVREDRYGNVFFVNTKGE